MKVSSREVVLTALVTAMAAGWHLTNSSLEGESKRLQLQIEAVDDRDEFQEQMDRLRLRELSQNDPGTGGSPFTFTVRETLRAFEREVESNSAQSELSGSR